MTSEPRRRLFRITETNIYEIYATSAEEAQAEYGTTCDVLEFKLVVEDTRIEEES